MAVERLSTTGLNGRDKEVRDWLSLVPPSPQGETVSDSLIGGLASCEVADILVRSSLGMLRCVNSGEYVVTVGVRSLLAGGKQAVPPTVAGARLVSNAAPGGLKIS